jgi:hypothetical protein
VKVDWSLVGGFDSVTRRCAVEHIGFVIWRNEYPISFQATTQVTTMPLGESYLVHLPGLLVGVVHPLDLRVTLYVTFVDPQGLLPPAYYIWSRHELSKPAP